MPRQNMVAVLKKRGRKPRGKGAQSGNSNSMIHGAFAALSRRNLDQRSKLARALRSVEVDLVSALGGDPTPQERIILDRTVYLLTRCILFEAAALSGKMDDSGGSGCDHQFLAWNNALRLNLQALGLGRRARQVEDLKSYLEHNQQQQQGPSDGALKNSHPLTKTNLETQKPT